MFTDHIPYRILQGLFYQKEHKSSCKCILRAAGWLINQFRANWRTQIFFDKMTQKDVCGSEWSAVDGGDKTIGRLGR